MRVRVLALLALLTIGHQPGHTAEPIGDAERGKQLFRQCGTCHQVGAGAVNRVGPHLNGLFGRLAASVDGFNYSEAMERAGHNRLTWTEESLDAYIENPKALVTGTRMNFRGLPDAESRSDIMAYLRTFSASPADIPEAEPTAHHTVSPEILAIEGDPAWGEYLSAECTTCHQRDGSAEGIPSITSWPTEDFIVAMHAYKDKVRPHPVMQMMAGRLSNEEIAALAAYFEGL